MKPLSINWKYADVTKEDLLGLQDQGLKVMTALHEKTGAGNDFLGWVDYAKNLDAALIDDLVATADAMKKEGTVLLVVGIGGSYLGAKSALEALGQPFENETKKTTGLKVYFIGHQLSSKYMVTLLDHIKDENVFVNVISKSGTTTEPAVAFRLVKKFMDDKYGKDATRRIVATTDESRGALKKLADQSGMKSFVIPDDVGGRFSVFTPVGLLPIAAAGHDIRALIKGANDAYDATRSESFETNDALLYALLRNVLYSRGKKSEILVNYEPQVKDIAEWWKQLYGESEGKDGKGILPHAMSFTTDLHSLGQYVQDGERFLFETILNVQEDLSPLAMTLDDQDLDGLNYLEGKTIHEINEMAMKGTLLAHVEGGVPNIILDMAKLDEYHLGYLYYFFMKACGISGYILDVNPFDQPGVEAYKKNMFGLLGKPGFEAIGEELRKKL